MTISDKKFLPSEKPQAMSTSIGTKLSPKTLIDKLIEVEFAQITTKLSIIFVIVFRVL